FEEKDNPVFAASNHSGIAILPVGAIMNLKHFVAPLVLLSLVIVPSAARAQGEQKQLGTKEIDDTFHRLINQRTKWMQGTEKPTSKDAKDLETLAQWYAWRPT